MQRLASILLLLAFAVFGSGALARLHNLEHDRHAGAAPADQREQDSHDETTCLLHALLRAPLASTNWAPLLASLSLLVLALVARPPMLAPQRCPIRITCRGPPAR